jgi:hypothetical protein
MVSRIRECQRQGVPITNYGIVIAHALGILERALEPFPEVLAAYHEARGEEGKPSFANATTHEDSAPTFVN